MPLILPSAVPLVVASPPALVAPGSPSVLPSPYVLRGVPPDARAMEELAEGVRKARHGWDPRPWWMRPSWPDPPPLMELDSNDKVFLTDADDFSDLRGRPGLSFVVIGSVSGKTVKITGAGTQAKPIVLRGASDDDSPVSGVLGGHYPELVNCTGALFATGSTRCILYRFRCDTCQFAPSGGSFGRVARVRFYGNTGVGAAAQTPIEIGGGSNLRVDRCVYGSIAGAQADARFIGLDRGDNVEACYNHVLNFTTVAGRTGESIVGLYRINVGETPIDQRPGFLFFGHHTLVSGTTGPVSINLSEIKGTDAFLTDNTILYDVAGGPAINIRLRHGLRGHFLRNLSKYMGGGRGGGDVQLRDADHTVTENASLNADGSVNAGTQLQLKGGNLDADTWLAKRIPGGGHNWENCKRASVGGNAMHVVVGTPETTYPDMPDYPRTFGADSCIVPPDGREDGNASSTLTAGWETNTDRSSAILVRLSKARALVALGPSDVGLALP